MFIEVYCCEEGAHMCINVNDIKRFYTHEGEDESLLTIVTGDGEKLTVVAPYDEMKSVMKEALSIQIGAVGDKQK